MDHHDLTARLARRALTPDEDEAVRTLNRKQAHDALRERVARGAFEGALLELARTSQNPRSEEDEVAEDIEMVLIDEITALAQRLTQVTFERMDRPMTSGSQMYSNGHESSGVNLWYEIEYPDQVVFQKGIRSKLSKFLKEVLNNRYIKRHQVSDLQAWGAFVKHPAVKSWMAEQWKSDLHDNFDPSKVPWKLQDAAEEAVYDNADVDVSATLYEEGGEREVEAPFLQWDFFMADPQVEITKATFDGRDFTVGVRVVFKPGSVTRVKEGL